MVVGEEQCSEAVPVWVLTGSATYLWDFEIPRVITYGGLVAPDKRRRGADPEGPW